MSEVVRRNHVQVKGKGTQPIVFAHGFGCDQQVWSGVAPAFEKDYKVVLFDYVGSGRSDKTAYSVEKYSSFSGYAQDLLEVCESLDLKDILLVGHSVSSMIGMLAAIEKPDLFQKLVMICPSPRYINEPGYVGGFEEDDIEELLYLMEKNYKEWAKYLAPVVMKNEDRPQLASDFEEVLCANDPAIARKFAEVTFLSDVRSELGNLAVPTLILQTMEDTIAPVEVGEFVHHHIKGSELVHMQASGHNPHMSDPRETIACIKAYIEK